MSPRPPAQDFLLWYLVGDGQTEEAGSRKPSGAEVTTGPLRAIFGKTKTSWLGAAPRQVGHLQLPDQSGNGRFNHSATMMLHPGIQGLVWTKNGSCAGRGGPTARARGFLGWRPFKSEIKINRIARNIAHGVLYEV